MEAFQSRMCAVVQARKEQEAAAQAIDEARAEVAVVAGDSDYDTAPPNAAKGIYLLLFDVKVNLPFKTQWHHCGPAQVRARPIARGTLALFAPA
jgi:hypothetical protein